MIYYVSIVRYCKFNSFQQQPRFCRQSALQVRASKAGPAADLCGTLGVGAAASATFNLGPQQTFFWLLGS